MLCVEDQINSRVDVKDIATEGLRGIEQLLQSVRFCEERRRLVACFRVPLADDSSSYLRLPDIPTFECYLVTYKKSRSSIQVSSTVCTVSQGNAIIEYAK